MKPDAPEKPLTSAQAGDILGVTAETVVSYAEQGLLSGFKLPTGYWRFHRADVERLVAEGTPS